MKEISPSLRLGSRWFVNRGCLIAALAVVLLLFCGAPRAHAGPVHELVTGFERPPVGAGVARLAVGPDGWHWGVAARGGLYDRGVIYKVKADGLGGGGAVFTAKLKAGGAGRVSGSNDTGLWAGDAKGELRLLLREGFKLPGSGEGSPVARSFAVLQAVSGSLGQGRAFDAKREVVCLVTLRDLSTAIVKVYVP